MPLRTQAGETVLQALLEKIPASAFEAGWLSYANVPALIRGTPGAVIPQSAQDFDSLQSGPGGDALLRAYQALAAGPSAIKTAAPPPTHRWPPCAASIHMV